MAHSTPLRWLFPPLFSNIEKFDWIEDSDDTYKSILFNKAFEGLLKIEIEKQSEKREVSSNVLTDIREGIFVKCNSIKAELISNEEKKEFITRIKKKMISLLEPSVLSVVKCREYSFWKNDNLFFCNDFATKSMLLCAFLKKLYEDDVTKHRHRCAHNLTSYQDNLPTLDVLAMEEYRYYNYFYRIFILILIDEVIIRLYKEYTESFRYSYL